jgi:hypothetical protein
MVLRVDSVFAAIMASPPHCTAFCHKLRNFSQLSGVKTQTRSLDEYMASQGLKRKAEVLSALVDQIYSEIGTPSTTGKRFRIDSDALPKS